MRQIFLIHAIDVVIDDDDARRRNPGGPFLKQDGVQLAVFEDDGKVRRLRHEDSL